MKLKMRSGYCYSQIEDEFADVLSAQQLESFAAHLQGTLSEKFSERRELLGRGKCERITLSSGKQIVLRQFLRGGWIRGITADCYLRCPFVKAGSERPFCELRILRELADRGVLVSRPVAGLIVVSGGGLIYRGFIATEFVADSINLLNLAQDALENRSLVEVVHGCAYAAGIEAAKMLEIGVYHPDLHVGNVLCTEDRKAVLIDFDRATRFASSSGTELQKAKQRLVSRWNRSGVKYGVGDFVSAPFIQGLYVNASR